MEAGGRIDDNVLNPTPVPDCAAPTVAIYLWGIMPKSALTRSIIVASLAKVSVELTLLPVTLKISAWLKRSENADFFDNATNVNPLKF
jgi:hypothetical protein